MAGRGAPTFLKRQKEQQRAARALAKRSAKQARREARIADNTAEKPFDEDIAGELDDQDAAPDDAGSENDPEN
jgi:hypothetical protein